MYRGTSELISPDSNNRGAFALERENGGFSEEMEEQDARSNVTAAPRAVVKRFLKLRRFRLHVTSRADDSGGEFKAFFRKDEGVFLGRSVPALTILGHWEFPEFTSFSLVSKDTQWKRKKKGKTAEVGIVPSSLIVTSHCK